MKPVECALLYKGSPALKLADLCETLNANAADPGVEFEEITPLEGANLSLRARDFVVSVYIGTAPLGAEHFAGALESPLSKPFIGALTDALSHHSHHIVVRLSARDQNAPPTQMDSLKQTHRVCSALAASAPPAALHWRASNQLLSGAQYLRLSDEATPWALFVRARFGDLGQTAPDKRRHSLELMAAKEFVGRPVGFSACTLQEEEMHAAALSFLKHGVETGTPIPDGHSFGPKNGQKYEVRHLPESPQNPDGLYELSRVSDADNATLDAPARASGAALFPPLHDDIPDTFASDPVERTRSLALGYLMLVIAPPLGVLLLFSNALFGSNSWRTGFVALGSVALALVVGAYTFLNVGNESAALLRTNGMVTSILADE